MGQPELIELIRIRPAQPIDAVLMEQLIATHFDTLIADPEQKGAADFLRSLSAQAFQDRLKSAAFRYTVADDDGCMAGFAAMRDQTHLYHLFIAKTHQGQGIARLLWEEQAAYSREHGNITGFTVNSSPAAQAVYEKFGFTTTAAPVAEHGVVFIPMQLQLMNP